MVIYVLTFLWLLFWGFLASVWHEGVASRVIMGTGLVFVTVVYVSLLRFMLPIEWRLRWPKWDAFLCRVGSHRCISICG